MVDLPSPRRIQNDSDNIEAIRVVRPPVPIDPGVRDTRNFLLLPPGNRFDRLTERQTLTGFHLNERHDFAKAGDQIDLEAPHPESVIENLPPGTFQKLPCSLFPFEPAYLPRIGPAIGI